MMKHETGGEGLRRVIWAVAVLNLAYFGIEFAVARRIGSVSLFADSVDFLEDASVNFLILAALGWSAVNRLRAGIAFAVILLIPSFAALWTAWQKFSAPVPPSSISLSLAGSGAFVVNLICALMLTRHRKHESSLVRAAFLSARNDVFANIAIVTAGFLTHFTNSAWPDLAVGLGIAFVNAGAAKEVYETAHKENRGARP